MTYLTASYVRAAAAKDRRIDPDVQWDEIGKALVWLEDGYTWDAQDRNRSMEGFIIDDNNADQDPRDTIEYWKDRVASITKIVRK